MAYIITDADGLVTTIFYGVSLGDDEKWTEVNSELFGSYGDLYYKPEAEEPTSGWDVEDESIGVVQS